MQLLCGLGREPERMAFSPDGRYLAAGGARGFHLWEPCAGAEPLWSLSSNSLCRNFVFTADGTSLLGGWYVVGRSDVRTGAWTEVPLLSRLRPHTFSPDGRFALTVTSDTAARVLRLRCMRAGVEGWSEAWQKDIPFDPAHGLSGYLFLQFSTDGRRLVRGFWRGLGVQGVPPVGVEVFDADSGELVAEWAGKLRPAVQPGAVGPNGALVLLHHRTLFAIDTTQPRSRPVRRTNASAKHFTSAAFTRDGTKFVTTSNDTAATLWDTTTWEVRKRYEWNLGRLRTICFAPDGLRCAAGSDTGQIVMWDLDD